MNSGMGGGGWTTCLTELQQHGPIREVLIEEKKKIKRLKNSKTGIRIRPMSITKNLIGARSLNRSGWMFQNLNPSGFRVSVLRRFLCTDHPNAEYGPQNNVVKQLKNTDFLLPSVAEETEALRTKAKLQPKTQQLTSEWSWNGSPSPPHVRPAIISLHRVVHPAFCHCVQRTWALAR